MSSSSRGYKAWLGYGGGSGQSVTLAAGWEPYVNKIVSGAACSEENEVCRTAVEELAAGLESLTGRKPEKINEDGAAAREGNGGFLAVGVAGSMPLIDAVLSRDEAAKLSEETYVIRSAESGGRSYIAIAAKTGRGLLYGVFAFLRLLQSGNEFVAGLDVTEAPAFPLRMINHWDNLDGSIERGYAGQSIFYRENELLAGTGRIVEYARMMASIGINGIAINNVNVHRQETLLITERYLGDVAKVADVFRKYGIKLYLSINFAAPIELGGLSTADPLDEGVRAWWRERARDVFDRIPDFGGFLVKADSENRPGPFTYGRDHADGANLLADALLPHGGVVLWRCFVYDCHQDWRDRATDRAKAAYDHFRPLDGNFRDNVILQIKNGPMDFQVREPVSPLYGAMPRTNQLMEFQITQEYTGQQRHVCYLIPQWKEVLGFDTKLNGEGTRVADLAAGRVHDHRYSGVTAVTNVGDDDNWTGHTLAQANLYGYGRLMWNPDLSSEAIADEWIRQTFGSDPDVSSVIIDWLTSSWRIYENYTSPLGVGWMVTPHYHYGPDVDGYEYSKWGTYHFADWKGIGVDRTARTGTGYTSQYSQENAKLYESLDSCPDELLLFFHHVPYTHVLKSGKTVIQHIYDTHFEGAEEAEAAREAWLTLEGKIDEERFRSVADRAAEQAEHAKLWRDVVNTYFYRKSGIPDERGRTIY
ncbi:alpha-glucuronidase family glycosyl hydrolase [Paenibacillus sp. LHD-117]|uniref:alpha-glucuronidase family glycosyl hydrolase n=1 Tax=Paenibacillus sp. LHD-117 TaxID=3071412 RepID=UPI0027DFCAE6|nr:alpha-glucuronidase family glycosyl hydrolase [Paenibacillus sp. LHD-117]MDQ6422843.1 alpha-glucuronidase family glycosyl hydrolase [Paenibacillus sp. LHD-117]